MESQNEQNDKIYQDPNRPVTQLENGACFLANLDVPARKPSITYLISLLLITLLAGIFYLMDAGQYGRIDLIPMVLCLLAILIAFVLHKCNTTAPRNWLTPDMFIVPIFCVFHFFFIVYYTFGLVEEEPEIFMFPDKVLLATFLCLCCLSAFLTGYEISGCFFKQPVFFPQFVPAPPIAIFLGKLLIILALVFYWGIVFKTGLGRVMADYQAMISVGQQAGGRFFWVSLDLAIVGIAVYCSASGLFYHKYMYGKIIPFFAWGFILGVLMMGDRGGFVRLAPVPIMAFYYFQYKFKLRWAIIAIIAVIFISGVIALTREVALLNVKKIAAEYKYKRQQEKEYNFITRTGMEFGSSLKIVVAAMEIVPKEYPYRYGASYIDSISVVIPNLIPGHVRSSESTKDVVLWINEMAYGQNLKWGRGGSIVMEAYLNFGFVGTVIFFIILGCGYRCLYERFLSRPDLVRTVVLLTATGAMMLWMRNALAVAIRPPVWGFVFAFMVQLLFGTQTDQNYAAGDEPPESGV